MSKASGNVKGNVAQKGRQTGDGEEDPLGDTCDSFQSSPSSSSTLPANSGTLHYMQRNQLDVGSQSMIDRTNRSATPPRGEQEKSIRSPLSSSSSALPSSSEQFEVKVRKITSNASGTRKSAERRTTARTDSEGLALVEEESDIDDRTLAGKKCRSFEGHPLGDMQKYREEKELLSEESISSPASGPASPSPLSSPPTRSPGISPTPTRPGPTRDRKENQKKEKEKDKDKEKESEKSEKSESSKKKRGSGIQLQTGLTPQKKSSGRFGWRLRSSGARDKEGRERERESARDRERDSIVTPERGDGGEESSNPVLLDQQIEDLRSPHEVIEAVNRLMSI